MRSYFLIALIGSALLASAGCATTGGAARYGENCVVASQRSFGTARVILQRDVYCTSFTGGGFAPGVVPGVMPGMMPSQMNPNQSQNFWGWPMPGVGGEYMLASTVAEQRRVILEQEATIRAQEATRRATPVATTRTSSTRPTATTTATRTPAPAPATPARSQAEIEAERTRLAAEKEAERQRLAAWLRAQGGGN